MLLQGVMKALNVNKLTRCGVTFKFWCVPLCAYALAETLPYAVAWKARMHVHPLPSNKALLAALHWAIQKHVLHALRVLGSTMPALPPVQVTACAACVAGWRTCLRR